MNILLLTYDDRDPVQVGKRVRLAREHGIDALVYGFFWCRGKRVFEEALDRLPREPHGPRDAVRLDVGE